MTVSSFGTLAVDGWAVTFGTRWHADYVYLRGLTLNIVKGW